ncbi:MAG: hypothetical protein R2838_10655 [Caldilineaceae bacterium]
MALPSYASLYLSTDFGDTFNVISQGFGQDDPTVSAAIFSPAEDGVLIYGFRTLVRAGIDGSNPSEILHRKSATRTILSIAVNPTDPCGNGLRHLRARRLAQFRDGGAHWDLIGIPSMQ